MFAVRLAWDEASRIQFEKRIQHIETRMKDGVQKSLARAGIIMLKSVNSNFESEGRPSPWAPLKPSTLEMRTRGGVAVLQDSGRLKRSITMRLGEGEVSVGTNVQYGKYHQFGVLKTGGKFPGKTIPQRQFLMFQDQDKEDIARLFRENVARVLNFEEPQ